MVNAQSDIMVQGKQLKEQWSQSTFDIFEPIVKRIKRTGYIQMIISSKDRFGTNTF